MPQVGMVTLGLAKNSQWLAPLPPSPLPPFEKRRLLQLQETWPPRGLVDRSRPDYLGFADLHRSPDRHVRPGETGLLKTQYLPLFVDPGRR